MKTTMARLVAGAAVTVGVLGYAASGPVQAAGSATASLAVSANVQAQCTIQAPNTLAFGTYDPVTTNASANLDAATTISVACTKNAPGVTVGLGLGANASGSTRRMASGAERLNYEIYSDSDRSSVWGNSTGTVSYTPTSKATTSLDVYGRIPGGQDVGVGNYSDTVIATINF